MNPTTRKTNVRNLPINVAVLASAAAALSAIERIREEEDGSVKDAAARLIAIGNNERGEYFLATSPTPLRLDEKTAQFGRFGMPGGFATTRYYETDNDGTSVETVPVALNYPGHRDFLAGLKTSLFDGESGNLVLFGNPAHTHRAYRQDPENDRAYQGITLPSGIPAESIRVLTEDGLVIATAAGHGKAWLGDGNASYADLVGGQAWNKGTITVFGDQVITRIGRVNKGQLIVVGSTAAVRAIDASKTNVKAAKVEMGAIRQLEGGLIPEAFLTEGAMADMTLVVASWTEPVQGLGQVFGYGLLPTNGQGVEDLVAAIGNAGNPPTFAYGA